MNTVTVTWWARMWQALFATKSLCSMWRLKKKAKTLCLVNMNFYGRFYFCDFGILLMFRINTCLFTKITAKDLCQTYHRRRKLQQILRFLDLFLRYVSSVHIRVLSRTKQNFTCRLSFCSSINTKYWITSNYVWFCRRACLWFKLTNSDRYTF